MKQCPFCHSTALVKDGLNPSGSQRYKCKACGRVATLAPKPMGYSQQLRRRARELRAQGFSLRQIAAELDVNHQTVANWVAAQQSAE